MDNRDPAGGDWTGVKKPCDRIYWLAEIMKAKQYDDIVYGRAM
jgi:hypothetical protein